MTTAAAAHPARPAAPAPRIRGRRLPATFAALSVRNFRIYAAGQALANGGQWMTIVAQDWLVLQLTGSSAAVGVTMAAQFLPMLLLGLHGGVVADRFPKRSVLAVTGTLNLLLSTVLAVLTISGAVRVEHVWLLALLGGCVLVVDNPTRQVFVNEVVPAASVRNAIALNSAVFQASRLVGPAVATVLISTVGTGWAFAANAVCWAGPLVALSAMRRAELLPSVRAQRAPGQLRSAVREVRRLPHVAWTIALVGVVGTFGLNFPVVLTAMADRTFAGGAALYGLFNTALALGSMTGALVAGGRPHTRLRLITALAVGFGLAQVAAALMPAVTAFVVVLVVMGGVNLAFQAMANSSVQLWVDPAVRGRVMGLYMLVFMGGTPLGAPLVGWVTTTWGPRTGMVLCGAVPALAALVVAGLHWRDARAAGRRAPGSAMMGAHGLRFPRSARSLRALPAVRACAARVVRPALPGSSARCDRRSSRVPAPREKVAHGHRITA